MAQSLHIGLFLDPFLTYLFWCRQAIHFHPKVAGTWEDNGIITSNKPKITNKIYSIIIQSLGYQGPCFFNIIGFV